jgi:hypothetical protein
MFTPFLIITWLCLLLVMKQLFKWIFKRPPTHRKFVFEFFIEEVIVELRERATPLLFVTIITLHTYTMSSALSPFVCKKSNDVMIMVKNPSQRCYGDSWKSYLPVVTLFLILYGLVAPLAIMWLLFRNKSRLRDIAFRKKFGTLYSPYKDRFFYWEIVSLLKRTVLISLSQLLSTFDYDVKMAAAVFLIGLFTFLEASLEPFYSDMSCLRSNA